MLLFMAVGSNPPEPGNNIEQIGTVGNGIAVLDIRRLGIDFAGMILLVLRHHFEIV